jgi:hypothetical protein
MVGDRTSDEASGMKGGKRKRKGCAQLSAEPVVGKEKGQGSIIISRFVYFRFRQMRSRKPVPDAAPAVAGLARSYHPRPYR